MSRASSSRWLALSSALAAVSCGAPTEREPQAAVGAHVQQLAGPSLVAVQQARLVPSDAPPGERFGISVAASGETILVGDYFDDVGNGWGQGSVTVFVREGGGWREQAKLISADGAEQDYFGYAVALEGNTAVVGAYDDTADGVIRQGSVYVFERVGETWTQQAKLLASDGAADDEFGVAVAISAETIVATSYNAVVDGIWVRGAAWVFVREGDGWREQAKLVAADGLSGDYFGYSLDLSGDTLVVGANGDDSDGKLDHGSAYVFRRTADVWVEEAKLSPPSLVTNEGFGYSVGVDRDTVVVGAPFADRDGLDAPGLVWSFERVDGVWSDGTTFGASTAAALDYLSLGLAIERDRLLLGAYGVDVASEDRHGAALLFTKVGSDWVETVRMVASDGSEGDSLGLAVAISGDLVVAGAPYADLDGVPDRGAAWLFALRRTLGVACESDAACESGFCVDGLCCETACDAGVCDACSVVAGAIEDGRCLGLTGPACDDGDPCTSGERCGAGNCLPGEPIQCEPGDDCLEDGVCDPLTGGCGRAARADGTACDDGDGCTSGDACVSGSCSPGAPTTCRPSEACYEAARCLSPDGTCVSEASPDGTPCEEGVCFEGRCREVPEDGREQPRSSQWRQPASSGCGYGLGDPMPSGVLLGFGIGLAIVRRRGEGGGAEAVPREHGAELSRKIKGPARTPGTEKRIGLGRVTA